MAGVGPPSTTIAVLQRQVVDADLRRHDDEAPAAQSQMIRLFLGVA
jgi:hypothetical protein